jgi:hypothetical protein
MEIETNLKYAQFEKNYWHTKKIRSQPHWSMRCYEEINFIPEIRGKQEENEC